MTLVESCMLMNRFTFCTAEPEPLSLPTPDTVFSVFHPAAHKWYDLGKALGVPEHTLDTISLEGSDQVRLGEVVQYYFSSTRFTHTWEEIVRALWEIEETESADRVVRARNLDSK